VEPPPSTLQMMWQLKTFYLWNGKNHKFISELQLSMRIVRKHHQNWKKWTAIIDRKKLLKFVIEMNMSKMTSKSRKSLPVVYW
jgi:hypothetical protein